MPNFEDLLKSEQTAQLMKNTDKLDHLRDAPETQRLFHLLSQSTGGSLEQAANRAAQGDTAQLTEAIRKLMQNPEGQQLIQQIKKTLQ